MGIIRILYNLDKFWDTCGRLFFCTLLHLVYGKRFLQSSCGWLKDMMMWSCGQKCPQFSQENWIHFMNLLQKWIPVSQNTFHIKIYIPWFDINTFLRSLEPKLWWKQFENWQFKMNKPSVWNSFQAHWAPLFVCAHVIDLMMIFFFWGGDQ